MPLKIGFRDKLFRYALVILQDYNEAQDVTQDALEKIWKKREDLSNSENAEALSMKMIKDLCYDKFKRQKMMIRKHNQMDYDNKHSHINYETDNLAEITLLLIEKLPEKQRLAIHLRDVEGCEFDEISKIMDIDVTAVRMNLSRARKTIKEQLEKISNYGL